MTPNSRPIAAHHERDLAPTVTLTVPQGYDLKLELRKNLLSIDPVIGNTDDHQGIPSSAGAFSSSGLRYGFTDSTNFVP
jgi:hypothetical protein